MGRLCSDQLNSCHHCLLKQLKSGAAREQQEATSQGVRSARNSEPMNLPNCLVTAYILANRYEFACKPAA
jgi:hypothetical protein